MEVYSDPVPVRVGRNGGVNEDDVRAALRALASNPDFIQATGVRRLDGKVHRVVRDEIFRQLSEDGGASPGRVVNVTLIHDDLSCSCLRVQISP
jgi:hypothetical protein